MKIVIDARESGTSSGRYVDKLIEYLHILRPKRDIILLAKKSRLVYLQEIAPRFTVIETPYKEFTFGEQLGFKRQIERLKPDLVHFPFVQQPVWYHGKTVTTMQDLTTVRFRNPAKNPVIFWLKQQVYKWVNQRVAKKSTALLTISEFSRNDIARYCHIAPNRLTVTLESADPVATSSEPVEHLLGKQFLMYVGRPTPHKNLGRLIDAFRIVQKKYPELHLALAGKKDFNYEMHEKTVKQKGIKNVVFTDFISDEQLRWMYENCRVYCFPSLSEGFGLPGLEAMIHGAPVASSSATCLPEVYGTAALYFDPYNTADISNTIDKILSSKPVSARLVKAGRNQVKKFSWKRMAEQTLEVYEKTLAKKEA